MNNMNQFDNNRGRRDPSSSRSRGHVTNNRSGNSYRSGAGSGSSRGSSPNRQGSQRGSQPGRRNAAHRRKKGPDYKKIAVTGVILIVLIACAALVIKAKAAMGRPDKTVATAPAETQITQEVKVDGVTITGMSKAQAKNAILMEYPWSVKVTYGDDAYKVKDLLSDKVDALLDEIYSGTPQESYTLDMDGMEEAAAREAAACAARWDKAAKNGSIDSYDKEKDKFVFRGEEKGFAIDQAKVAGDIVQAMKDKQFGADIQATGHEVSPDVTAAAAKEKYKIISTFTTTTTANKDRNTNVRLAAEALNGTVVQPGEEFSFNAAVGQRTDAKGYKGAAAYNNGEVVQEIGGGVCQVSTTLYNAAYRSGLGEESITFRRSHTFEPNYITPGQDATVSWEQPDFRFKNTSNTAIGILAKYGNQKMTVSVYGIPILEDGMKLDLESRKVEDMDVPAPTYEEDQTLQPGVEIQKKAGTRGSRWETYKVLYKDGKEVSRELDHKTTYKGHAPVIRRNTTGVVLPPNETTTQADTEPSTVDGMPDGYIPGDGGATVPSAGIPQENGPGLTPVPGPGATQAPAPGPIPSAPSPGTGAPGPGMNGNAPLGPGGNTGVIVTPLGEG